MMRKIRIHPSEAFLYPMSVVLVGVAVGKRANFMAVGWVSRVNYKPPLFGIALSPHHTNSRRSRLGHSLPLSQGCDSRNPEGGPTQVETVGF